MADRFTGKVVWITGGGSGLGKAMALEFAREGANVVVSGRREENLKQAVSAITEKGLSASALVCDVTDEEAISHTVSEIGSTYGRLDVAVANAGFAVGGPIEKLRAGDWRRQLDTNVIGLAMTAKHALPLLKKQGGRLALISSVSGMMASPKSGAYTASKYAVRAIGQTLSMELAGTGTSCTTLYPGFVESEIAQVDNQGVFHAERPDKRPGKLMWTADKAAKVMIGAIHKRRRHCVFTGHGKLAAWLGRHCPVLLHYLFSRSQRIKKSGLLER
jgi:NAD(P)-dependent dehydrogenase (short-subunit alcohol dehydrogenase family)